MSDKDRVFKPLDEIELEVKRRMAATEATTLVG
jgi:hypothetical protein